LVAGAHGIDFEPVSTALTIGSLQDLPISGRETDRTRVVVVAGELDDQVFTSEVGEVVGPLGSVVQVSLPGSRHWDMQLGAQTGQ
jgi:hypothetical protein